jgi:hypothetical protein
MAVPPLGPHGVHKSLILVESNFLTSEIFKFQCHPFNNLKDPSQGSIVKFEGPVKNGILFFNYHEKKTNLNGYCYCPKLKLKVIMSREIQDFTLKSRATSAMHFRDPNICDWIFLEW